MKKETHDFKDERMTHQMRPNLNGINQNSYDNVNIGSTMKS